MVEVEMIGFKIFQKLLFGKHFVELFQAVAVKLSQ